MARTRQTKITHNIDHNVRSHQFFQSQNLWRNGTPPSTNTDYYNEKSKYNKNLDMDHMMRLTLDCLSAIGSFMNPEINYLGVNYDKRKAQVFWESIKSISQSNIDIIINSKEEQESTDKNSVINELIKLNFPYKDLNNEEKYNWYPFQWATIHYKKLLPEEYKQLMSDNMSSIRNDCKPNQKVVTVAHLIATGVVGDIPMETISYLFNKFPTLASTKDPMGRLPLHYAAEYCKDGNFLQYIIQQYPKALITFTDKSVDYGHFENLPIDLSSNNLEMFQILLLASEESLWLEEPVDSYNFMERVAVYKDYSSDCLQLLIEKYPDAVRKPYYDPLHLLHTTIRCCSCVTKVSLLLNIFKIRDSETLTIAAIYSTKEVFKLIFDAFPEGIINEMGADSTLHLAVRNCISYKNKNLETIKYICETFPHLTKVKNESGNLPLSIIVSWCFDHYRHPYEAVKAVYDTNPDAVKVMNNYNELPIHFLNVIENPYAESLKIIKLICSDFPESLDIADPISDDIITPYNKWSPLSDEIHRYLSRIGRLNHDKDFRDLNYKARRMAMFLAFRGISDDLNINIWRKLKLQNNMELLRYTIAFL